MNKEKKRWLIVGSVVAIVIFIALGVAVWTILGAKDNVARQTPDTTQPASSQATGASPSDANGLITAHTLECVPRGHDNYRTNGALAVDPKDSAIAYAGVEYKGVYKTTDGGATWSQSDKGIKGYAREGDATAKCVQELGSMLIDPKDSKHLLLSRIETPSTLQMIFGETAGLYESRDAGATWKQLITKDMNASGSRGIAFDPKDSRIIYYGVNNMKPSFKQDGKQLDMLFNKTGILYKTTDSGRAWQELPTGADEGFRTMGVFVDSANSGNILLATFNQDPQKGGSASAQKGILKSSDGGKTWTAKSLGEALAGIAVAPQKFTHVYAPTQSTNSSPKAYYSLDGTTFKQAGKYMLMARYDPNDPSGLRMLGYSPYDSPALYESLDGGATWGKYANLPGEVTNTDKFGVRISELVWAPGNKNILYMSGSGGFVWKSTDAGKTWATILTLNKIGGENHNKDGSAKSREPDQ